MLEGTPLFFLGSVLMIIGLFIIMFSLKRVGGDSGIILIGPIPIILGGKDKSLLIVVAVTMLTLALLPLVFLI